MIPAFNVYLYPFLKVMGDGKVHNLKDIGQAIAKELHLSDDDLKQTLPSNGQTTHYNRCGWARTWYMKAGVISSPSRSHFVLTPAGRELLNSGITEINRKELALRYPSFAEFAKRKSPTGKTDETETDEEDASTPLERIEAAYDDIEKATISEILQAVKEVSPKFFEHIVVQLLVKMGYGGDLEGAAQVTQFTADGGIDGVIKEDALGLDKIYVQAKRWNDKVVGSPDIQQFIGALMSIGASKGIYITTSHFSDSAKKIAASGHLKLVLMDGDTLARYMLRYNLGVVTDKTFEVKRLDIGFFNPED